MPLIFYVLNKPLLVESWVLTLDSMFFCARDMKWFNKFLLPVHMKEISPIIQIYTKGDIPFILKITTDYVLLYIVYEYACIIWFKNELRMIRIKFLMRIDRVNLFFSLLFFNRGLRTFLNIYIRKKSWNVHSDKNIVLWNIFDKRKSSVPLI